MGIISAIFMFFKNNNLAALLLAAGLLFAYHKVVVEIQENKIQTLTTDNETLKTNQKVIEEANKSLQSSMAQLQFQQEEISKSVKEFQTKTAELRDYFDTQRLRVTNNQSKLSKFVKKDPKGFIDKANRELRCVVSQLGKNNCLFDVEEKVQAK